MVWEIMKKLCILLCGIFFLLLALPIFNCFTGYDIHRNIKYGEKSVNVMDVYIPQAAYKRERNGCVLFIHGGSWSGGDKKEESFRCRLLASRGYISASLNYTLWSEATAKEYTVFEVLDEIKRALLKLKDFTAERGLSVEKVGITGYSAGAHLAMLYSYSQGDTAPMELAFTASIAGPAEISPKVWGEDMTIRIAKRLTGKTISEEMLRLGEADELLASISPTSYINENTPPTLIMHGGKDNVVPPANADFLTQKLSQNSIAYDYIHLKNSNHTLIQNPFKHLEYYEVLVKYCKRYF